MDCSMLPPKPPKPPPPTPAAKRARRRTAPRTDARGCDSGIANARPNVVRLFDRLHDEEATRSSLLDRYRKGWSEANPDKILDVTAPGYRFRDPSLEAFRGGRCTSISISCRTDSPAQGQSRGGISAFS